MCAGTAGGCTHIDISFRSSPRRPCVRIEENKILADLTSFKIGGKADYFCYVRNEKELREALKFAKEKKLKVFILGGGTNVLAEDKGFRGLVIKMELKGHRVLSDKHSVSTGDVLLIAEAGENWDNLVETAVARGLWGIENLSGIPGTVGAAPVQNIGAYGCELSDILEWVDVIDRRTCKTKRLSTKECQLDYRESVFKKPKGKDLVVLRVAMRLQKEGKPNLEYKDLKEKFKNQNAKGKIGLQEIRDAVLEIRSKKFPKTEKIGNAGSFFKNPVVSEKKFLELKKKYPDIPSFPMSNVKCQMLNVKISLAWILDKVCNLKGFSRGSAALWEKQPLVLANTGNASAKDIKKFAEEIAKCVRSKTGIKLEWEVRNML